MKGLNEDNQILFQCEKCGLKYTEKEWVEKCEERCTEYQSCNLDIVAHAHKES